MEPMDAKQVVRLDFTNHRGEQITGRLVLPFPTTIRFAATQWHPEKQWVFDGHDLERNATRTYALASVTKWEAAPQEVV